MSFGFRQIPAGLLVPGSFQEIDNSLAGETGDVKKVLILGYKRADAPALGGKLIQVLTAAEAIRQCGSGSPAAIMASAFKELNKTEELWILPVAEPSSASKWTKAFTVSAVENENGTVTVNVNGKTDLVTVKASSAAADIAADLVGSINSMLNCSVEAVVNSENPAEISIYSVVGGVTGNYNTVSFSTEALGVTITDGIEQEGRDYVDLNALWPTISGIRFNYIISDFADIDSLFMISRELSSRYSGLRQIGGRCFVSLSGELGSTTTTGSVIAQADQINSEHIVLIPRMKNIQHPCEWSARFAATACRLLADDPAVNTSDVEVTGLKAEEEMDFDTRQALLESGIATWRLDPIGKILIERLVTSYTENSDGERDTSYLDIQVVETVDAVRTYINSEARKRFKTWKLAKKEENFGSGAKVMSPGVWNSFLVDLYQNVFMTQKQWCQDFDSYKSSIKIEIKAGSKTRLDYVHEPVLIGQFYQAAGINRFK